MYKLFDDELWEKCRQGGSITPQDLGLKNLNTEDATYWTGGLRYEENK